jgi:hypothetical protein
MNGRVDNTLVNLDGDYVLNWVYGVLSTVQGSEEMGYKGSIKSISILLHQNRG